MLPFAFLQQVSPLQTTIIPSSRSGQVFPGQEQSSSQNTSMASHCFQPLGLAGLHRRSERGFSNEARTRDELRAAMMRERRILTILYWLDDKICD